MVDGTRIQVAQVASALPVEPAAKLLVHPGEFPFLQQIRGHDDELIAARMAADPAGFPWLHED
jgi:predicted hotdog family 3-hydroxylacyl-ACP dehydratase